MAVLEVVRVGDDRHRHRHQLPRWMLTNWVVETGAKVGREHAAAFELIRP
jgi:hypothetical protein